MQHCLYEVSVNLSSSWLHASVSNLKLCCWDEPGLASHEIFQKSLIGKFFENHLGESCRKLNNPRIPNPRRYPSISVWLHGNVHQMEIPLDTFAQIFYMSFGWGRNFFNNHIPGLVLNSGSLSDFWSPGYMWLGIDLFSVGPELDIAVTGTPWKTDHPYW